MAIPWADSIMEAPSCRVQPDGRAHGFESMDPANPPQPFHDGLYPGDDAFGVFDGLSDVFTFNEAMDPASFLSIWNFADASATTANSVVEQPTSSGTVNMPLGLHQPDSKAADELFLFLEQPDQSNERSAEFGEDVRVEAELSIPSSTFPDYFNQMDLFEPNENTIGNELEFLDFQFTPIELDWPSLQKNEHTLERPTVAKNTPATPTTRDGAIREPNIRRNQIPPPARRALENQFTRNPYPSPAEMAQLVKVTECDVKQIRTWFNNARARRKKKGTDCQCGANQHDVFDKVHLLHPDEEPAIADLTSCNLDAMSECSGSSKASSSSSNVSIERFLQNPEESASTEDILKATFSKYMLRSESFTSLRSFTENGHEFSIPGRVSRWSSYQGSVDGSEGGYHSYDNRSCHSLGSSFSDASRASISSHSRLRRKGRRSYSDFRVSPYRSDDPGRPGSRASDSPNQNYHCTFCGVPFNSKYTWRRHEESVHVPQTTWVCSHRKNGESTCLYCGDELHPSLQHDCHRCITAAEPDRTFYRRDQFKQHVRQVHQSRVCEEKFADLLLAAERPAKELEPGDAALLCGFCGINCSAWDERVTHVSGHFKQPLPTKAASLRKKRGEMFKPGGLSCSSDEVHESAIEDLDGDDWEDPYDVMALKFKKRPRMDLIPPPILGPTSPPLVDPDCLMHEGDRFLAPQDAASKATPALRQSRSFLLDVRSVAPPALSPRTSRRNMLDSEFTENLFKHLL